jgi:membrane protein implicated in regulation of membrane protease activity
MIVCKLYTNEMDYGRYTAHAIITTLLEQAALVAVVLWLLPMAGINIPLWGLISLVAALGVYASVTYRLGRKTLAREPILSPGVGSRGRTTTLISPTGYVRVNGELWPASSESKIGAGEEVSVAGMEGMTLLVRPADRADAGTDKRRIAVARS